MKIIEMRVVKDGDAWMFVLPNFKDLVESESVWVDDVSISKYLQETYDYLEASEEGGIQVIFPYMEDDDDVA
jgi:hypothetical protein